jgi:hypothetical protein
MGESNQIKPNQTSGETVGGQDDGGGGGEGFPRNSPDATNRGDMGESKQIKPNQTFSM